MVRIGVTGSIGMGKSTFGDFLGRQEIPVIDSDQIAKDLVQPGHPCLQEIFKQFGEQFKTPDGGLNRRQLAELIFSNEQARAQLEGILHPPVRNRWLSWLKEAEVANPVAAAVLIPLLFETGAEREFDVVVCVACSRSVQWKRLSERGWNPTEIENRIASQMSVEDKILRSQFVIWSDGALNNYQCQIRHVLKDLGVG